ncbi:DoxX family protein [Chryseobacterium fluminis]|uniref:HvfX family Cu-binding RiPP maturation protein n=1 Tax=Chryseobacterium fluminis TaxID=2983606 RepID=UPI00224DA1F5|nr:DoxX family protein [Chryseobacterium sp. MMS21-Ot14]UZT98456.1 DoxX family protein [Chryseobacterium sp. MMS21-Ot14]
MINPPHKIQHIVLLTIRFVLAYGFFKPALMKITNIHSIADWFTSINIPFPALSAYITAGTESIGVIFLTLGLFTRWISIPLIITMTVAIVTVHLENGFEAGENGFEIPLYYIIMLVTLFSFGGGKYSLDQFLKSN